MKNAILLSLKFRVVFREVGDKRKHCKNMSHAIKYNYYILHVFVFVFYTNTKLLS